MKLNKIFMALAAMTIVGCSSDDLSEFAAKQAPEQDSRLVELNPNFVLAGVGEEGNVTRTHWEQDVETGGLANKFLPIYKATPYALTAGNYLDTEADLTAQAVGLCWLGQGTVGTDVYTNYQFYHFGWLNNDETEADVDMCGTLYNGALYSDIKMAAFTNGNGGEALPGTDWLPAGLPDKAKKGGADNLNYNSGVYQTKNKSIFGGDYIVYYPFNEDFNEAGTIPAIAETSFDWDNTAYPVGKPWENPMLGEATFRYSDPVTIEGGFQAADFTLHNLSTLVRLRVSTIASEATLIGDNIDKIVLYSATEKFLKQANLAADKIVAGQKGAALYAEDGKVGTKTITTNFKQATSLNVKATTTVNAFITALPTTVDDLVVYVHNATDGTWAKVDMGNTVIEAGKAKVLEITVTAADFTTDYIAVDEASLITARNEARAEIGLDPTAKPTITVIGEITLDGTTTNTLEDPTANQYDFNTAADANITITGDAITVAEDVSLVVKYMTIESEIRVLGKSCCSDATFGGKLYIHGCTDGTTVNNITMVPTEARVKDEATYNKYNPYVSFIVTAPNKTIIAAGSELDVQAGRVVVAGTVEHKGSIKIAEDASLTVNAGGDLNFRGTVDDKIVNDGTIEVKKDGKFDITAASGPTTVAVGQRMTNNGKFIHNVDAGVGTSVQNMHQNGEYRCRVDKQDKLDDAFLQWKACSVIEMVNTTAVQYDLGTAEGITPTAYKHNGKFIDIEVNSGTAITTFKNPTAGTNADNKDIQVGNLTVTAGGLTVDFIQAGSGTTVGKRTLTVNGDMTVAANTTFNDSKMITIQPYNGEGGNLTVKGAGVKLAYEGNQQNEGGLEVKGDITVSEATFDAGAAVGTNTEKINALKIKCANFYLEKGATASFGNRSGEGAGLQTLKVTGTIDNPEGCTFDIVGANQDGAGSVMAWITCGALVDDGTFTGARPIVE